ncbi:MAG: DUF4340 domain-containing protein [Betaproteobacteria bacterium]|nr:DUF4340 domain-containing protein [Betaproteobacteria bacterium]
MSRVAWLNAALFAVVAALGTFVYFKPAKDAPADYPLSALKPAEAKTIRIERTGAAPMVLEQKQNAWFLVAPFAARGEEAHLQRLLEMLEARSAHRLAATDLARFGLDAPQARVTIGGQAFGFGMVSPVAREQYVLTNGAVFAVHPRYGTALPARAAELASRRLFGPGETPVRVALADFTVEQRDGKWRQTPDAKDSSQDDFAKWIEAWRNATALQVEPHAGAKPPSEIRIALKEGGALTLGLLAREPQLVLLRPDEKLQYYFRPEIAKRLLSPPDAARDGRKGRN